MKTKTVLPKLKMKDQGTETPVIFKMQRRIKSNNIENQTKYNSFKSLSSQASKNCIKSLPKKNKKFCSSYTQSQKTLSTLETTFNKTKNNNNTIKDFKFQFMHDKVTPVQFDYEFTNELKHVKVKSFLNRIHAQMIKNEEIKLQYYHPRKNYQIYKRMNLDDQYQNYELNNHTKKLLKDEVNFIYTNLPPSKQKDTIDFTEDKEDKLFSHRIYQKKNPKEKHSNLNKCYLTTQSPMFSINPKASKVFLITDAKIVTELLDGDVFVNKNK